ncbi:MAG TPA: class I SAM-dependent methyltransferase family protein [Acidimicrobiia bacterium]|nr:class I SAM-dependent methyltransferase family protein [Acidimicrobiia bacterium]
MSRPDWLEWHRPYDEDGSPLQQRLAIVQGRVRDALDGCTTGPVRLISMCAGQGRDVVGALVDHPRRDDVSALLVELDARNVAHARSAAAGAGLDAVRVVCADASTTGAYVDVVPAEVVLACGIFGNVSDEDVQRTVQSLPMLCAPGATVIWTRHRRPPDLTVAIREWFADAGFDEVAFDTTPDTFLGVGTARLVTDPRSYVPGVRMFTFTGDGSLGNC